MSCRIVKIRLNYQISTVYIEACFQIYLFNDIWTQFLGRSTDCAGQVTVRDLNDNPPKFANETYEIIVDEEKSVKHKIEVWSYSFKINSNSP